MTIELAQSLDLVEVGKTIGSLGSTTLLGIAVFVLWRKLDAERDAAATKLQAAQDKLDAFQEARIKELAATLAALGGGK